MFTLCLGLDLSFNIGLYLSNFLLLGRIVTGAVNNRDCFIFLVYQSVYIVCICLVSLINLLIYQFEYFLQNIYQILSDIGQLIIQRDKTVIYIVNKQIMLFQEFYSNKEISLYIKENKELVRIQLLPQVKRSINNTVQTLSAFSTISCNINIALVTQQG